MKQVSFAHNGRQVHVKTEANVLSVLLTEHVPVLMACGGRGLCATCHVYIERGADALSPRTKKEERTLALIAESDATSRLACRARVLRDGVVVRLPKGLYIEKASDLMDLLGRRAEGRILHPVNGRTLVEEGKIITRGVLVKLAQIEVDVQKVLAESRATD